MELSGLELYTERLILRPLTVDDVDIIHQIWTNAGVRKFLWDDEIVSFEDASIIIKKSISYFHCNGLGLWAVMPRGEERIIGFCGHWFFHEPPQLELLYGLIPECWGKGLALEAARAMLRFGFEELNLDEVAASANANNFASARVLEKLGMRFSVRKEADGVDTVFYVITREEFFDHWLNQEPLFSQDDWRLEVQHR